jgi:hypothetical protein
VLVGGASIKQVHNSDVILDSSVKGLLPVGEGAWDGDLQGFEKQQWVTTLVPKFSMIIILI